MNGAPSCDVSIDREVIPYAEDWDENGSIPQELWPKAAEVGLLGMGYPEEFGGVTEGIDLWHGIIVNEEMARVAVGGVAATLLVHGIGLPPVINFGSDAIKQMVAPPVLAGTKRISLAITEPGGGSDVAQLQTTARLDGDHYVVNGSKTYITGGMNANWFTTAVRTGGEGSGGVSTLLIPADAEGVSRTALDRKQGWWCSDTATIYFDNVSVPVGNLLGQENKGFAVIMNNFNSERLAMSASMEALFTGLSGGFSGLGQRAQNLWSAPGGSSGDSPQDCRYEAMRINATQAYLLHDSV